MLPVNKETQINMISTFNVPETWLRQKPKNSWAGYTVKVTNFMKLQVKFPQIEGKGMISKNESHLEPLNKHAQIWSLPGHIIVRKFTSQRKEKSPIHRGKPIRITSGLSAETLKVRTDWKDRFEGLRVSVWSPRWVCLAKSSFKINGENKHLPRKAMNGYPASAAWNSQRNPTALEKVTKLKTWGRINFMKERDEWMRIRKETNISNSVRWLRKKRENNIQTSE